MKFIVQVPVVAYLMVEVDFEEADQPDEIIECAIEKVTNNPDDYTDGDLIVIDEVMDSGARLHRIVYDQDQ